MSIEILKNNDPAVYTAIRDELERQQLQIELIASENIASPAVMAAQGSVLTNKYAEGYPGRRYYGGCEHADTVEDLARDRIKQLFNCSFANVQPHSGAQANQAVMLALLKPGDTILGMALDAGGHLTHGSKVNLSGKWFNSVAYGIEPNTSLIDYDEVERLALEHKPQLIIAGCSSYPRVVDFARFREIADQVDAYLLVDMAHYAGLIAGGVYPNPLPHAHIVTSTTHKTLRSGRGGIILSNDIELGKKINSAVFPGLQGGPLMHIIAAKAVGFGEALRPEFKEYARAVLDNARAMAAAIVERGYDVVTGGTDCHMVVVDLRSKGITGKQASDTMEAANLTCNKNGVSNDPQPPMITSGIRLGSPAGTTRGFGVAEFSNIGHMIADVLDQLQGDTEVDVSTNEVVQKTRHAVIELCKRFPIYEHLAEL